ncbi:cytochrome P450 [Streptomyces sp. NPDC050504]|uniref:cytochrome P450 n=1 Tax=Streptomyces sp. NPDC050504 TaxID=3365618 RepID=UPI0037A04F58
MNIASRVRAPGALPLLGHTVPLLRDPMGFLTSLPRHGDLVDIRIGPFPATVVCDPRLVKEAFLDDRSFDKGGPLYDRGRESLGNGLVSCTHDDHRRQRKLTQPAFHGSRFAGYGTVMTEQIEEVVGAWREDEMVDVYQTALTISARSLVKALFARKLPEQVLTGMIDDSTMILAGIFLRMLTPHGLDRLPTPPKRRYDRAIARLRAAVDEIIAEYRAEGVDHHDLLSLLLASRDDHLPRARQSFSDTEICDQVVTFFIAGIQGTAVTLTWALYQTAAHPVIEKRLQAEADEVLGGRIATYEDLEKLPVAERIVTETLRVCPPVWMLTRTTTADTVLGNRTIKKGTVLVLSQYLVHHLPALYPDPHLFDPDRWDSPRDRRPPETIPFGHGARKCIGSLFGTNEAAMALATIAGRWSLQQLPGVPVRLTPSVLLTPKGIRMRPKARHCPSPRQET